MAFFILCLLLRFAAHTVSRASRLGASSYISKDHDQGRQHEAVHVLVDELCKRDERSFDRLPGRDDCC